MGLLFFFFCLSILTTELSTSPMGMVPYRCVQILCTPIKFVDQHKKETKLIDSSLGFKKKKREEIKGHRMVNY